MFLSFFRRSPRAIDAWLSVDCLSVDRHACSRLPLHAIAATVVIIQRTPSKHSSGIEAEDVARRLEDGPLDVRRRPPLPSRRRGHGVPQFRDS